MNTHSFIANEDAWFSALRSKGASEQSLLTYRAALLNLRRFLIRKRKVDLFKVTQTDLEQWQQHLVESGCQPATQEAFTQIIRRWFAWQCSTGRLFANPASGVRTPKAPRTLMRCPSEADMKRLLDSVSGRDPVSLRDRALLEIAYSTGARRGELAGIDLTAFDLGARTVRLFGKGGRERVAPLTKVAASACRQYLSRGRPWLMRSGKDDAALFLSTRGYRRLTKIGVCRVIERRSAAVGLGLTPHDLRRACATHLMIGGAHPTRVEELLGHKTGRHLRRYVWSSLEVLMAASKSNPSR